MNKTKSPALTLAKYFLILPLSFLFVMANSIYAGQNVDKTAETQFADESAEVLPQPIIEYSDLPEPPPEKKKTDADEVFVVVEEQPQFPGGIEAMMQFLKENIHYPKEAHEKGIQGRVIVNFVIMKDGSIDTVNVVRGVDPLLDAEAVRVVEAMPKWEPGMQRGQAVKVRYTLPIVFRLNESKLTQEERADFQKEMENFEKAGFPGGNQAFMKYLAENVRYPVIAQENGIQGLVSAVFNVDSKGKVSFVRFEKGVNASLDAEVKRVIENMPDWTPAKLNGEATGMTTGTHFLFRLQGDGVESYNGPVPEDAVVVVGYANKKASEGTKEEDKDVFVVVDEQPEFPGGPTAMLEWLRNNITLPDVPESGLGGRVIVNFIVEKDGSVGDVEIVRGVDPSIDKDAVRTVKAMPKWKPGRQGGKPVRVRYTLPIKY